MDTFSERYMRLGDDISVEEVRSQIHMFEEQHKAKGNVLSGRVLQVCHYLPITATLSESLSPPTTPPHLLGNASACHDAASSSLADSTSRWSLGPRDGHSAMNSGIQSLCATHEQVVIGWTGDIHPLVQGEKNPSPVVTDSDKAALGDALRTYQLRETDPGNFKNVTYIPVWLDDKVAHGHYDGYCKQTNLICPALWPLFHYLLWQDVATEYASADSHYPSYLKANAAFAQRIMEVYRPGDIIWVHDYHLLLVPKLLREKLKEATIGLYVHTPFPSSEVFRCLPRRREILDGMLGANLVCFQSYSYCRHFTSTCLRVCGYEILSGGIDGGEHVTNVMHCPVGVDAQRISRDLLRPGIQPKIESLRALYEGKKILVGRDKLDVVKGIVQKLRGFERLLQDYPEWIGNVVMIQVTSPALCDSPKLERQISELVAHINGEYGSLDFIPVHHYHQTLKKDEFYALLSVADLGVTTPLRDAMNSTSMEFVIAQAKAKKSPSVLSEFMAISKLMEDALQVNPCNLGEVAAAINQGLLMSEDEKIRRHSKLYKLVTTHTSHTWAALLVKMLLGQINSQNEAHITPYLPKQVMEDWYQKSSKRLFLFDYDGTLAPIVKVPSMAIPSNGTLEALSKLSADPKNIVYIISGRDSEFLDQHLGHIEDLGMSAEHGGFIREPGGHGWTDCTENLDIAWMDEVLEIFRYYTARTTGSHIEVKKCSITWHYRSSDPEWGAFQCKQCQDLLENNFAHKRAIEVVVGKKNLEVRPISVNKGEIVKRILYKNPDVEYVFCAGDDKTDEDMYRALVEFQNGRTLMEPPLSVTLIDRAPARPVHLSIKPEAVFTTIVGHTKRTLAAWHVRTPTDVVEHMLCLTRNSSE